MEIVEGLRSPSPDGNSLASNTSTCLADMRGVRAPGRSHSCMASVENGTSPEMSPSPSPTFSPLRTTSQVHLSGHASTSRSETKIPNVERSQSAQFSSLSPSGQSVDLQVVPPSPNAMTDRRGRSLDWSDEDRLQGKDSRGHSLMGDKSRKSLRMKKVLGDFGGKMKRRNSASGQSASSSLRGFLTRKDTDTGSITSSLSSSIVSKFTGAGDVLGSITPTSSLLSASVPGGDKPLRRSSSTRERKSTRPVRESGQPAQDPWAKRSSLGSVRVRGISPPITSTPEGASSTPPGPESSPGPRQHGAGLRQRLGKLQLLLAERQQLQNDIENMLQSFGVVQTEGNVSISAPIEKQAMEATLKVDYTVIIGNKASTLPKGSTVSLSGKLRDSGKWRFVSPCQVVTQSIHCMTAPTEPAAPELSNSSVESMDQAILGRNSEPAVPAALSGHGQSATRVTSLMSLPDLLSSQSQQATTASRRDPFSRRPSPLIRKTSGTSVAELEGAPPVDTRDNRVSIVGLMDSPSLLVSFPLVGSLPSSALEFSTPPSVPSERTASPCDQDRQEEDDGPDPMTLGTSYESSYA